MSDDAMPPVGATVTDGFGVTWTCVSSRWTTDGFTRERLWESATGFALLVEYAKDTTALWRLQQERDGLKADKKVAIDLVEEGNARLIQLEAELATFRALAGEAREQSKGTCGLPRRRAAWAEKYATRLAALAPKEASHE